MWPMGRVNVAWGNNHDKVDIWILSWSVILQYIVNFLSQSIIMSEPNTVLLWVSLIFRLTLMKKKAWIFNINYFIGTTSRQLYSLVNITKLVAMILWLILYKWILVFLVCNHIYNLRGFFFVIGSLQETQSWRMKHIFKNVLTFYKKFQ